MAKKWAAVAAIGGALVLAGCSQSTTGSTAQTPSQTPSPKPTTYAGETASAIASSVPACTQVTPGDIGKGGPDMTSTASCVIGGRTVDFDSWSTNDAVDEVLPLLQKNKEELYYATGNGWTAFVRNSPVLQWQLTNNGGELFDYGLNGKTDPPRDLPGEQATLQKVADALQGATVYHFTH
jgi:hypothetical protein